MSCAWVAEPVRVIVAEVRRGDDDDGGVHARHQQAGDSDGFLKRRPGKTWSLQRGLIEHPSIVVTTLRNAMGSG